MVVFISLHIVFLKNSFSNFLGLDLTLIVTKKLKGAFRARKKILQKVKTLKTCTVTVLLEKSRTALKETVVKHFIPNKYVKKRKRGALQEFL